MREKGFGVQELEAQERAVKLWDTALTHLNKESMWNLDKEEGNVKVYYGECDTLKRKVFKVEVVQPFANPLSYTCVQAHTVQEIT